MGNIENIVIGSGNLFINNIDVGFVMGSVSTDVSAIGYMLSPDPAVTTNIVINESFSLKISMAELKKENLQLALGTTNLVASSVSLSYDPSSFSVNGKFNQIQFGCSPSKTPVSVRFECIKPNNKRVIVVLYKVIIPSALQTSFLDTNISLLNFSLKGSQDMTRPLGKRVGFILTEI